MSTRNVLGACLVTAGAGLVPWLVYLACALPAASAPAWCGLDALEAAGLVTTGLLLRRNHARVVPAALVTAALLVADAYADITTATTTSDLGSAITMALLAELPTAALCTVIALRAPGARGPAEMRLRRVGASTRTS